MYINKLHDGTVLNKVSIVSKSFCILPSVPMGGVRGYSSLSVCLQDLVTSIHSVLVRVVLIGVEKKFIDK